MGLISFENEITELVQAIVKDPFLHGLWLNTLSYLENCGARKIASCEHPTAVKEEMLKHASEEFRHAFYLKKQLGRINQHFEDYRRSYLLGGWPAYHYLNALDLYSFRYLQSLRLDPSARKELAYLLVTYAIELRAAELYPLYHSQLIKEHSRVQVKSILLEEHEHLQEMESALSRIPKSSIHIENICRIEANLFATWLVVCVEQIKEHRLALRGRLPFHWTGSVRSSQRLFPMKWRCSNVQRHSTHGH